MVKAKKGKKEVVSGDEMEGDVEVKQTALSDDEETSAKQKKGKKDKKKANVSKKKESNEAGADSSEDDDADDLSKGVKGMSLNTKKKGKKQVSDDEDDDVPKSSKKKGQKPQKGGFDLLMADDDDDDVPDPPSEKEEPEDDIPKQTSKKGKGDDEDKGKGKKSKKSKKKKDDSDEDIDKVLAELEQEYSGVKKAEPVVATPDDIEEETDKKKKGKKKAQAETASTENIEKDEDGDGESTVKSAAQKKKEKKERQKREAALAKQKGITTKDKEEPSEKAVPEKEKSEEPVRQESVEAQPEGEDDGAAEDNDGKKDDKKKKKKDKGKKDKEEDKEKDKKKGGLSKTMVAAMQERVKKMKEEEERFRQEEEERLKREEELENLRLEAIRLEQEKKEKKKQKEADRKARLKAEGKLLTKKQKEDRARAQAMLEALKAQGVDIPDPAEKKPRPGTRVRPNKKKDQKTKQEEDEKTAEEQAKDDENASAAADDQKTDDVKDAWDASSSEEEDDSQETSQQTDVKDEAKGDSKDQESDTESDSDEEDSSDEDSDSVDDKRNDAEARRERAVQRIKKRQVESEQKRTLEVLRAAVVCVLGHVDTGKTKILDKLRRTHVQDAEAGGITQQIGATNVPIEAIKEQTKIVKGANDFEYKLPGLLIIDTPGHESFSNLRNRGSSLCDIAILVVDIMHGLEPQTIESINLLKSKKTPFIVALNKIDRLYDWQTMPRKDVRDILKAQQANTQLEFNQRTKDVILQFAEQGLNAALFYDNPDPRSYVSLVPTSAITGEGMGNLLYLIIESCQSWLAKRLMYSEELQATVLEVKAIPGLGTTIDTILINGRLREGETMIVAGTDGPIVTQIRSLLMPQPLKELRVKNAYIEHKEVRAAQGVKIAAKDLEKAIAGINLLIAHKPDEVEICKDEVARELKHALSHIKLKDRGVYVQASTLGSLEALLEFLRTSKIPYSAIRIGPVVKRDVMKASTMLEHESQYATILAFDVKVERDAQDLADSLGVKIFQADIIYHLFDKFMAYREELKQKKRDEFKSIAVFPCKLKILPQFIFNSRDPIVCGVMVENGIVKEGTPICVPSKDFVDIGIVTSIESNHKQIESARKGQEICIKIEPIPGEAPKMFGRHFDENDMLVSKISRQSIDACKDYFRDDLIKADWALMLELKKLFEIL